MPNQTDISALSVLVVSAPYDQAVIMDGLPSDCHVEAISRLAFDLVLNELFLADFDLIIIAAAHATQQDVAVVEQVMKERPLPIIWFVEADDQKLAPDAIRVGTTSFVVDGLKQSRISSLVVVALERYKFISALEVELRKSKDSLAARKIVERAKGLLMEKRGLSEHEAYKALRSMAMRQGKSLKSVCEAVLSMAELLP
jgi:response regulator NasT